MTSSAKLALGLACALPLVFGPHALAQTPVYQNPSAPFETRVDDLLSRMTLEEKISQLMNDSPAIDRLGIPAYNWWNECLHGVARAGRATVFPEDHRPRRHLGSRTSSSASPPPSPTKPAPSITNSSAAASATSIRASPSGRPTSTSSAIRAGAAAWRPTAKIRTSPAAWPSQFIKGLQGDDPKYLKTVATAKHYAVHSGPESERHTFDAVVDERDLRDTYLPQFEAAIKEGGAYSVMCAYNSVDGEPACANPRLLERDSAQAVGLSRLRRLRLRRDRRHLPASQVRRRPRRTGVAQSRQGRNRSQLRRGVYEPAARRAAGPASPKPRSIKPLRRLLPARFKLGMFDPPAMVKYAQIPYSVNDSPAHRELALETARKSIVLLKNENHTLPLEQIAQDHRRHRPQRRRCRGRCSATTTAIPTAPVTPLAGHSPQARRDTRVLYARGSDLAANMPELRSCPGVGALHFERRDRRNGLTGEYYNSCNFDGKPHRPRELTYPNSGKMVGEIPRDLKPLFTRVDPQIDFQWWDGAPRAGHERRRFRRPLDRLSHRARHRNLSARRHRHERV